MAAFIDLKKAFDTVDLRILLDKLNQAGIRNGTLQWCKNYLSGRVQRTVANNSTSDQLPVTCSVPQGSVLGPLFFLVFINDLDRALTNCNLKLYADDSVIYVSGLDVNDAVAQLQTNLDKFSKWCRVNKLTINTKKPKLMVFGSRSKVKRAKNIKIKLAGDRLKKVPTYKYLGLVLDSTLNYNHHISYVIRTVLYKLMMLAKLKKYMNDDVALQIYRSMLLPYLDYADVIFYKSNSGDLEKLQRLQNRCLRLCCSRVRNANSDRLHKLNAIPFLKDRRKTHLLNLCILGKVSRDS